MMSKRTQKDAGEERVTAKIETDDKFGLRDAAKGLLTCFASTASQSPGENQT